MLRGSMRDRSDPFQPPDPAGLCVAHHFCSRVHHTGARPTRLDTDVLALHRPCIQHLMPRGGLQDHLCCFTPPQILCTLDAFPSDQGKFRVSFLVTTTGGGSTLSSLGLKKSISNRVFD